MRNKEECAMIWYLGTPTAKDYNINQLVERGLEYFKAKYQLVPTVVFSNPQNKEISLDITVALDKEVLTDSVVIASSEKAYTNGTTREE